MVFKDPSPTRYIALYKFTARDENDVNVERGEILTVLNKDDPEWFYVVRSDGQEGFVPSAFVYPLTHQQGQDAQSTGQPTYQQIDEHGHEYSDAHVVSRTLRYQLRVFLLDLIIVGFVIFAAAVVCFPTAAGYFFVHFLCHNSNQSRWSSAAGVSRV